MSVKVDELARDSMVRLHNAGSTIIALTGRAGAEASKLMKVPGAFIIGTGGWELYETDPSDPNKGRSIIDERLVPYHKEITSLLSFVRQDFLKFVNALHREEGDDRLTYPLESQFGRITLETKGVNESFPEGIGHGYNFARIEDLEVRARLASMLAGLYQQYFSEDLKPYYEIDVASEAENIAVEIRPLHQRGKAQSLLQILRKKSDVNAFTGEKKRGALYDGIPDGFDAIFFFGDTDGDSQASRAAHLVASFTKIESAGVAVIRREDPKSNQKKLSRYSDLQVDDIKHNGELLCLLADVAQERAEHSQEGTNIV
jgi:hypothetical protein